MNDPYGDEDTVDDVSLDGPMLTTAKYPLARTDLKCADCGADMQIRSSSKYPKPFYGCSRFPECRGSHGAYIDGRPMGIPANKETKLARIQAHKVFDVIWKDELVKSRRAAYSWMGTRMGLNKMQCHISMFDKDMCEKLIALVKEDFPSVKTAWDRILETPFDAILDDPSHLEDPYA